MSIFVPLHIITGYSFLQSGLTLDRVSKGITLNGYYGAGLTDSMTMHGVPGFIKTMESLNKPYIIGMSFTIDKDNLSLFVINEEGYRNLIKINSLLQQEGFTFELVKEHSKGLICVIETKYGTFRDNFLEGVSTTFTKYLLKYSSVFSDNFYLGVEVTSREDIEYAKKVREFASNYTYECVAFPRIKYLKKDDAIVLSIVEAIDKDEKLEIKNLDGYEYFMSEVDYQKIYTKQEIVNTVNIVNKSAFSFHQKRGEIIHASYEDSSKYLRDYCINKLHERGLDNNQRYIDRLNHELEIIISMGYADYFLLVQDYVSYAKSHEILVGPGRGSAAGSLVAYLLDITEPDPLKYNLQFERFLNPHRKTMPDIDVDFMDIRRDEMVQYMRDKYGNNRVANIVTYQTILAKQALRDIGRVYGFNDRHISMLSKMISDKDMSLRDAYRKVPEFKKLIDSDKYFLDIVSLASKIEGLPRQSGMHAAGVVVNNSSLDESIPVSIDEFTGNYVSQYEAQYLEEQGFLKMDFLGLRNLTIIGNCVDLVNQNHPEIHLDKLHVPYDEPEVYQLIASGQTMGIFQLESTGMKRAIKILKPYDFDEIVKLLALFRPGPMDSIKTYAGRRDGRLAFRYVSDNLKEVLEPTKGIIVYQEQINDIARIMAGFSMADADLFRRAVSKKDKAKLESGREAFIKGALANGYSEKTAIDTFNHIMKFAEYGFNKSHSVVYAMISSRMAWLKLHYPLEFYASILDNGASSDGATFNEYISEMKLRNYNILPPSINKSGKTFVIEDNNLRYPLTKVRQINDLMVSKIMEERKEEPFNDFFDFVTRMTPYKLSNAQIEKLIDSGALDELHPSRATMRSTILPASQYATLVCGENGQLNLGIAQFLKPAYIDEVDNPLENLEREYDALGIMLSNNPLHYKQDLLQSKNVKAILSAKNEMEDENNITMVYNIAGIVKDKKIVKTKKGDQMAFIKVYDETGDLEVTIFPILFGNKGSLLEKNTILVIKGKFDNRNDELSFIADDIARLEE